MHKPILILDAGGVIIEDLAKPYWELILSHSDNKEITLDKLYSQYRKDFSDKLWTGDISEAQLLHFLAQYHIHLTAEQLSSLVAQTLQPLPAFTEVERWAKTVDIYIMSNHRSDWLLPALSSLRPYLTDIYISDSFKQKKPSIAWFEHISALHPSSNIMFVDNTLANVEAAQKVGWNTIFADTKQQWIANVDQWLDTL